MDVDQVLAGVYVWEGFPAHASAPSTVSITDFYDCDGARAISAALFITVVAACDECRAYLTDLEPRMDTWEPAGVRVVVLVADSASGPATVSDAEEWKSLLSLDSLAVVADPNFSLVAASEKGFPNQVLVDPRTMRVVCREVGFSDDFTALEDVVAANGG